MTPGSSPRGTSSRLNPAPKETPRKPRQTESPSYRSGVSTLAREAIRLDVGSIPEVTFDFYRDTVLPRPSCSSDNEIKRVKASLIRDGFIENGRWLAFATDPAKQEHHEDIVFQSLFDVNNRILRAANLNKKRNQCTFVQKPHEAPTSTRTTTTRPDGFRLCHSNNQKTKRTKARKSKAKSGGVAWEDIVEVEEYKKRNALEDVRDASNDITLDQQALNYCHSES